MRVYDAELAFVRLDNGTNVDAAIAAKQKVCCHQTESISIEPCDVRRQELNNRAGVRGTKRVVRAAKPALAGAYSPVCRVDRVFIRESDRSAMAAARIVVLTHGHAVASGHTAGWPGRGRQASA